MENVRWGIIGVGNVCEVKSGPGFQKAEKSSLVAVMRRSGDLARDFAARHGVPKWYDDAAALINDPDVNAIYIATPPYAHLEYTLATAQAGKPVYVEKPMANTYAECTTMIDACEATGVPLFVAYYRRALPRFLKIKELVDGGAIGEVRTVTVMLQEPPRYDLDPDNLPWRVIPELAGGGLLLDLGSHMLDFLDYVLGPIAEVQGAASNQVGLYPAEDMVTGSFVFESGVHGVGTWCFSGYEHVDRTEIIGSKGKIVYSNFDTSPVLLMTDEGPREFQIDNPPHVQQPLIQTVVNRLTGAGICDSTGESGARTSWVIDHLLAGYRARMET
jgi:predicted dehydrogenase